MRTTEGARARALRCARGRGSVLSACGCFSCCSVLAFASAFSVLSVASVFSTLSVGSTWSLLSVGSVDSVLSVGSYGCYGKVFSNCHRASWDGEVSLDLRFSRDAWERMERCDFDDYQSFKKFETVDDACAHQSATCTYTNVRGAPTRTVPCTARRKGFSTFRAMDDRPSFKVKFYEDAARTVKLDLPLGTLGRAGSVVADKATFNNMAHSTSFTGNTEVEAYDAFHRMDYAGTPGAAYVRIRTYRGDDLVDSYVGSVVEDVNNDDYFKRVREYGDDRLLLEVDNTGLEYKDAKGRFKSSIERRLIANLLNRKEVEGETDGPLDMMRRDEVVKLYAAERATHNWDGACLRPMPNNFYVLAWEDANATTHVRYVPKGMDWVFQGCVYDWFVHPSRKAYCGPVQRAEHEDPDGFRAAYDAELARVPYRSQTCGEEVGFLILFVACSAIAAAVGLAAGCLIRRRWRRSDRMGGGRGEGGRGCRRLLRRAKNIL
jgi:hypothetical protein